MRTKIFLFCLLNLLGSGLSLAQEPGVYDKSEVLKGISSFEVVVEQLHKDSNDIGLTKDRLITVTELKLRREGLLSSGGLLSPYVYINVNVVGVAFSISLEIHDMVQLVRDPSIIKTASTWDTSTTGTHGGDPEYIVTALNKLLDIFLNDYYKANPKK